MNRREAIIRTSAILGVTLVGANAFLAGCDKRSAAATTDAFDSDMVALLDEVAETILPATPESPGAKAAQVGLLMKAIVLDCYEKDEQAVFLNGVAALQLRAKEKFNGDFISLDASSRLALLESLDEEARAADKENGSDKTPHYFSMIKQLTILGYFTSEVGCTKALRYNPVPGKYVGCIDYKKGDRAWSDV